MAEIENRTSQKDVTNSPSSKLNAKSSNVTSNNEDKIDSPKASESVDRKSSLSKKNAVDSTAPRLPPKPVREQARVLYPYTALNEDELSLKEGDIITIISKEVEDKGWWKGELNNRTGVFPDNFVKLIKVEEQRKPERPDKPSTALTSKASLKSSSSDKSVTEFSPKVDKKALKTPPIKPPPPEIHKKELERPMPPFPSKKPQVPHPMKKPSRSSLGSKFSGFSSPSTINVLKPTAETAPASPPAIPATEAKPEVTKTAEKLVEKEDKRDNQGKSTPELGFENLESSGKKLVHLTANRAKAPNRRPPSHVFLKETEKENGSSCDPRRLSEPLLSEMKSIFHIGELESHKANVAVPNEVKITKVPPTRPMPPSIKGNKPAIQGSVVLTKTISSEECVVKAPEPIKKGIYPDPYCIAGPKEQSIKTDTLPSDFKLQLSEKDLQNKRESTQETMVSRNEFNELAKQVKELKDSLENFTNICKIAINDLQQELEAEKKRRQTLEIELHKIKENLTT